MTHDGEGGRDDFAVCIAVMNINEAGKITLLDEDGAVLVQPFAQGTTTAELTDPDGGVTGVTWVWSRSEDDPPTGDDPTAIDPAAASDTYTPTNADTGYFLSVTATYADLLSAVDAQTGNRTADRMETETTMHAVLEVEDLMRPPRFLQDPIEVEVAENSPSTTYVGEAIGEAVDPDKGTTLTYSLEGDDKTSFALDEDTRQIQIVVSRSVGVGQGREE